MLYNMTLVLASKFRDGVAFAYDKLVYGGQGIPKGLEDKVSLLGNLAVGMSGNIVDGDECASGIAKQFGMLLGNSDPQLLMYSLSHSRTSRRLQRLDLDLIKAFRESYLFGFMDGQKPRLFFYDDTQTGRPIEKDCEGIGFGMYPEVRSHMERYFDRNRPLDDVVNVLNDGMQIAFEVNRTSDDEYRLSGLGFTVVTNEGVRRHQRKISEVELRFIMGKYGSLIQKGYGNESSRESIIKAR